MATGLKPDQPEQHLIAFKVPVEMSAFTKEQAAQQFISRAAWLRALLRREMAKPLA